MKNFAKITAIILCAALLASCSQNDKNKRTRETTERTRSTTEESESETTTEATTTTTTEATTTTTTAETTESEEPVVYTADIDSQLQLIIDNFDMLNQAAEDNFFVVGPKFAVTDLNHNGRLELILSDNQGSGFFSYTRFYEVSDDYSSLVLMNVNGEAVTDEYGDFTLFGDDQDVTIYNCYTLDGKYYYELGDYASAGWSYKAFEFQAYCFDTEVERTFIGGCSVSVDENISDRVNVSLVDSDFEHFADDASYIEYLDSYWSGYESQGTVEVKWISFEDEADFEDGVRASYLGYNPDSDRPAPELHDYREYFGGFYGDDYEYVIVTE